MVVAGLDFGFSEAAKRPLEKGGFGWRGDLIQAVDVDRAEPWPDGQDRQEDQALPL